MFKVSSLLASSCSVKLLQVYRCLKTDWFSCLVEPSIIISFWDPEQAPNRPGQGQSLSSINIYRRLLKCQIYALTWPDKWYRRKKNMACGSCDYLASLLIDLRRKSDPIIRSIQKVVKPLLCWFAVLPSYIYLSIPLLLLSLHLILPSFATNFRLCFLPSSCVSVFFWWNKLVLSEWINCQCLAFLGKQEPDTSRRFNVNNILI